MVALCCNVLRADFFVVQSDGTNAERAVPPHTIYNIMMFPYKQTAQLHLHGYSFSPQRLTFQKTEVHIKHVGDTRPSSKRPGFDCIFF